LLPKEPIRKSITYGLFFLIYGKIGSRLERTALSGLLFQMETNKKTT